VSAHPRPWTCRARSCGARQTDHYRKAGTRPEQVLELLPQGRIVAVPTAGHFVDTEAVTTTTTEELLQLLSRSDLATAPRLPGPDLPLTSRSSVGTRHRPV